MAPIIMWWWLGTIHVLAVVHGTCCDVMVTGNNTCTSCSAWNLLSADWCLWMCSFFQWLFSPRNGKERLRIFVWVVGRGRFKSHQDVTWETDWDSACTCNYWTPHFFPETHQPFCIFRALVIYVESISSSFTYDETWWNIQINSQYARSFNMFKQWDVQLLIHLVLRPMINQLNTSTYIYSLV